MSKYIKPLAKLTNVYGHCALDITEAQTEYRSLKTVATALVWKKTDCEKQITKMAPIRTRQAKRENLLWLDVLFGLGWNFKV